VLLLMYMDFLHTSTYQQGKAFTLMTVQHLGCVACLIKLNYNFKKTNTTTVFLLLCNVAGQFILCSFWATVCKTVRPMLSDHCPVCNIGVLWSNGWMDQDETWQAGTPQTWPHCVRWGPSSPSHKGAQAPSQFSAPYLLWPNDWMDEDATWYGGRPRPRRLCVDGDPVPPPQKGDGALQFLAHVCCGQTAGWIKMALGVEMGLDPGHIVLDGNPAPFPQKEGRAQGGRTPTSFWPISVVAKRLCISGYHLVRK